VISGLSLGDRVIADGVQRARPGQQVSPGPAGPDIQAMMKATPNPNSAAPAPLPGSDSKPVAPNAQGSGK
jgi:membrane fusion protein (multidrug efflux system)